LHGVFWIFLFGEQLVEFRPTVNCEQEKIGLVVELRVNGRDGEVDARLTGVVCDIFENFDQKRGVFFQFAIEKIGDVFGLIGV
jgi:hypothetical protein